MMAESFVAIGIVTVLWVVVGYSLAFGTEHNGLIGGLGHVMLHGVGAGPRPWNPHVPGLLFMVYQGMFAVISPALITGAFTSRMHFHGYLAFIALWSLLIYCPFAHWVWGGGFLGPSGLGAVRRGEPSCTRRRAPLRFPAVLYLGRRREEDRPHSVPLEELYVVVYLDALQVAIRDQQVVRKKAVYSAIGVSVHGERDVLGLCIEKTEGARFWTSVLTELRNRGVKDILFACTDVRVPETRIGGDRREWWRAGVWVVNGLACRGQRSRCRGR